MRLGLILIILFVSFLPLADAATGTTVHLSVEDKKSETVILSNDKTIGPDEEYDRLIIIGGDINFQGRAKTLIITSGHIVLEPGSRVEDRLIVVGGELEKKPGAQVSDHISFELPTYLPQWFPFIAAVTGHGLKWGFKIIGSTIQFFLCFFSALFFYRLFPNFMQQVEQHLLSKPIKSLFWSFGAILFFVPGILILVITLIGILLIPTFILAYGALMSVAYPVLAGVAGRLVQKTTTVVWKRLFVGSVLLSLVYLIPGIGFPFLLFANFMAFGGIVAVLWLRLRKRPAAAS